MLVSGSGTLLQALIDEVDDGRLPVDIVAVGADRASAYGLVRARQAGVPTFVHPLPKGGDRAGWDAELTRLVASYRPDLVVMAGVMKLVGDAFLARFGGRTINSHPALLPSFPGAHGVRDALAYGVKVTGCTVFQVDEGVDTGRILAQTAVPVRDDDTEETLHERIKTVERRMLVDTVRTLTASPTKVGS